MSMNENTGQNSGFYNEGFPSSQSDSGSSSAEKRNDGGTIKEKAREAKDRVLSKSGEALNKAKERTRSVADEQKNRLGERIHGYSSAFRRTADKLRDEQDPNIAHYTEMIADRIDQAADYVQSRDPGMLLRDVENAARRRPEIFFGGMLLAGLVLGRFLKASSHRDDDYENESDEEYWVEDEAQEEPLDDTAAESNFAMTSGEAAGDWRTTDQQGNS